MKLKSKILSVLSALMYLPLCASAQVGAVQADGGFLRPLQQRDSILIADQLEFGFRLQGVEEGTALTLPDYSKGFFDSVILVRDWTLDTLKVKKGRKGNPSTMDIEGKVVITSFDEGMYFLPSLVMVRTSPDGQHSDSLVFESFQMEVKTIPVDTATFVIHDIKAQAEYPVTFAEIAPYLIGAVLLAALLILVYYLVRRFSDRKEENRHKDPAYIVALRSLEAYKGEKYWAADKQKIYYSGITDTLRVYMADRFSINATEMTTAEIFDALSSEQDLTPALYKETRELFELADFVKFAKHTASNEENAAALPAAVRFITSTYQAELENHVSEEEKGGEQ